MQKERIRLDYGQLAAADRHPKQRLINNISTVVQTGDHLWLASDEGRTIERLSWTGNGFGNAASISLDDYFRLPDGPKEIDVEGLAVASGVLWVAGSHSLARVKPDADPADPVAALARIERRPRRYLLGRLALTANGRQIADAPTKGASLRFTAAGNELTEQLAGDPHLGPFCALPDKENGLDIEGVAAAGEWLWLGLRGPTIRGYAIVIAVRPTEDKRGLRLQQTAAGDKRYRKHFLALGGLGVRDLAADQDDLLILAGPTMGLAAPWAVLRWHNALTGSSGGIVDRADLVSLIDLVPESGDHPEGITAFHHPDGRRGWLVVYDNPQPSRVSAGGTYEADFFF